MPIDDEGGLRTETGEGMLLTSPDRSPRSVHSVSTAGDAMALFWFFGGLAMLAVALLPHPAGLVKPVFLVIGAVALPVAATVRLLRDRLPLTVYAWLLPVGTALVTVLTASGGGGSASVALSFYFLWVVLYAVVFFTPVVAAVQIGLCVLGYVTVTATNHSFGYGELSAVEPVSLVVVVGTTATVVVHLVRVGHLSELDPLTSAANRRGLARALEQALRAGPQEASAGDPLILAVIDVDNFKELNDAQGHQAGDAVLQQLVTSWRAHLRQCDTVARFGGDEFIVLLPACGRDEATAILERLRHAATTLGVTCSVGGTERQLGETASRLIHRADLALYDAKLAGRDLLVWA